MFLIPRVIITIIYLTINLIIQRRNVPLEGKYSCLNILSHMILSLLKMKIKNQIFVNFYFNQLMYSESNPILI